MEEASTLERGFLRLGTGLGLAAWLWLLLAELGWFSAGAVVASLLLAGALAGVAWARPGQRRGLGWRGMTRGWRGRHRGLGWRELVGPAAVLLVAGALYFPAHETVVWADDSTAYLDFATRIDEGGGLVFEDPLLRRLPVELRRLLFRNTTPLDTTGEYVRFPGGFLIPDISESQVTAGFSPLFPVLLAAARAMLGPRGMFLVAPLFALLSVAAVFLLARRLGGAAAGYLAAALLAVSLPQVWFARYGLPEPVAQFFVLAGVLALVAAGDHRSRGLAAAGDQRPRALAAAGGALLGLAALAKVDLVVLAGVSVLIFTGLVLVARKRWPDHLGWFVAGFVLPSAHLVVHYAIFPSHYLGFLARWVGGSFVGETWRDVTGGIRGSVSGGIRGSVSGGAWEAAAVASVAVLLIVVGVTAALRHRTPEARRRLLGGVLLAGAAVYFFVYFASTDYAGTRPLRQLGANLSWPLLGLAVAGCAILVARGRPSSSTSGTVTTDWRAGLLPVLAGVVCLHYLYNPLRSAGELWNFRRLFPVVVPAVAVIGAVGAGWLTGRAPAKLRTLTGWALSVALVALVGAQSLVLVGARPWEGAAEWTRKLASRFPADSLVLVSPELAGTHLATSLAYLHGRDAVLVQRRDTGRAALRPLIRSALSGGRSVHFVLGNRGFGLFAPRLHLELRRRDELSIEAVEAEPSGGLRPTRRSVAIEVVDVGLRPSGPPGSVDVGDPLEDMLFRPRGFHLPERDPAASATFRWTGERASLTLPAFAGARLLLDHGRPPGIEPPRIRVAVDGETVVTDHPAPEEPTWLAVPGPDPASPGPVELTIRADTFNPRRMGLSGDGRDLGVRVYAVELRPETGG